MAAPKQKCVRKLEERGFRVRSCSWRLSSAPCASQGATVMHMCSQVLADMPLSLKQVQTDTAALISTFTCSLLG